MGINIGICETQAEKALCKDMKKDLLKVMVEDSKGFEDVVEYDYLVPLDRAHEAVDDWEAFMKRNRINAETDAIYIDKLKKDEDIALMTPLADKVCTGWVILKGLEPDVVKAAIDASKDENRLCEWDMLSFDEMNELCAKCPLSWDKGRGCMGSFGPDNSLLPEIAARRGFPILASVPESAAKKKIFTPDEGKALMKEVEELTAVLPEEGKMMVRRYSGPLERTGAVAKISAEEGCGFYFF